MSTDLAIIIVNWNVKDLLRSCLTSALADIVASSLSAEIWVVDNGSTDDSVEMLRHDFPKVRLIANKQNLGFAGGNNAALREIGFADNATETSNLPETVLLLNPDTEVHGGALKNLYHFLKNNPQAGIAGARLVYGDGSFQMYVNDVHLAQRTTMNEWHYIVGTFIIFVA